MEISGHSAGLDGHQIPSHTCNNSQNHCTIISHVKRGRVNNVYLFKKKKSHAKIVFFFILPCILILYYLCKFPHQ